MLITNLLISTGMIFATVVFHFFGLSALIKLLRAEFAQRWREKGSTWHQGATILLTVFGLILLHAAEIWAYAVLYLAIGEFRDVETALYFSTTNFTTLGFGDVVASEAWRQIAALEGFNGFILIGWSTAFLVSVTAKMGFLEAHLERDKPRHPPRDGNSP